MKNLKKAIFITILVFFSASINSQEIKLISLIDSALANKANIKAVRTDIEIARLQTSSARQKYLPELSLNYSYRYRPVIPTQIIPVGQFNPVPTDEKRPIQFGTEWDQSAGLSVYQPILDLSVRSRIQESRINEKLKNTDASAAEKDLMMEVVSTFTSIWLREEQLKSSAADTLRTARTRELILARAAEGKILKTEINRAELNHNSSLSEYTAASSSLIREKLYMAFLTGMDPYLLLDRKLDFTAVQSVTFDNTGGSSPDSLPSVIRLKLLSELIAQQQKTEKLKAAPVAGIEAFAGASQYADSFNPFLRDSWYGNSYLGLNLSLPLFQRNSAGNRVKQLKLEAESNRAKLEEELNMIESLNLRLAEEIRQYEHQTMIARENIELYRENIELNQERFNKGQISAYDLLSDEIDLQKETAEYNAGRAGLVNRQIELLNNSGVITAFIDNLRK